MNKLRDGLEERVSNRLKNLQIRKGYNYFLTHLDYPLKMKAKDEAEINSYITRIEILLPSVESLLKAYRKHIPHIWDQTKFAAAYLLIGKAFNDLKTVLDIAKKGSSHELVELCRSAVESLDLVFLFLEDSEDKLLEKWFKGEIITSSEARKAYQKILDEEKKDKTASIPIKDAKSDVYGIYSLYTHSSYSALLDSVDVFYEDFDYRKYAGFHYTRRNLHLIDNLMINILLGLKNAFLRSNDPINFEETDKILKQTGYTNMPKDAIDEIFEPYR